MLFFPSIKICPFPFLSNIFCRKLLASKDNRFAYIGYVLLLFFNPWDFTFQNDAFVEDGHDTHNEERYVTALETSSIKADKERSK